MPLVRETEPETDRVNEPDLLCVADSVLLTVREKLAELVQVEEEVSEVDNEEVSEQLLVCVREPVRLTLRLQVPELVSEAVCEGEGEKVEVLVRLCDGLNDTV